MKDFNKIMRRIELIEADTKELRGLIDCKPERDFYNDIAVHSKAFIKDGQHVPIKDVLKGIDKDPLSDTSMDGDDVCLSCFGSGRDNGHICEECYEPTPVNQPDSEGLSERDKWFHEQGRKYGYTGHYIEFSILADTAPPPDTSEIDVDILVSLGNKNLKQYDEIERLELAGAMYREQLEIFWSWMTQSHVKSSEWESWFDDAGEYITDFTVPDERKIKHQWMIEQFDGPEVWYRCIVCDKRGTWESSKPPIYGCFTDNAVEDK